MIRRLALLSALLIGGLAYADMSYVIRRDIAPGSGGGGSPPPSGDELAFESINDGAEGSPISSSTETVTTTANTSAVVSITAVRTNAGQNVTSKKFNGVDMSLATSTISGQLKLWIYFSTTSIPSAGTYDIVTVLSASAAGMACKTLTFTGDVTGMGNPARNTVNNVATSTITSTGNSIGDMWVGACFTQDYSLSIPSMNTPDLTLAFLDGMAGTGGNGGWLTIAYGLMTGTSQSQNVSWSGGRNHSHAGAVLQQ